MPSDWFTQSTIFSSSRGAARVAGREGLAAAFLLPELLLLETWPCMCWHRASACYLLIWLAAELTAPHWLPCMPGLTGL